MEKAVQSNKWVVFDELDKEDYSFFVVDEKELKDYENFLRLPIPSWVEDGDELRLENEGVIIYETSEGNYRLVEGDAEDYQERFNEDRDDFISWSEILGTESQEKEDQEED